MTGLVAATAHVSGAHINPAVTFALCLAGKMNPSTGLMYVYAHLNGALFGALLITFVIADAGDTNLGAHGLADGVTVARGLIAEAMLTFVLVFTVFATAVDPRGLGHLAPIAIGLAVFIDHLFGVPITGASMNPARSFGPALISGTWDNHLIFWIGHAGRLIPLEHH